MKRRIKRFIRELTLGKREIVFARLLSEREFFLATLMRSYREGWINNRCIFVLSTGRAGTMQLSALLDISPGILALHEPPPVLLKAGIDAYYEGCDHDKWNPVVHAARDELIAFANHHNQIYVETNNRLTFLAQALAAAYPASKFIHLHRHPYEVVQSGMNRNWYKNNPLDPMRIIPVSGDPHAELWDSYAPWEKIAWFWSRANQESALFLRGLPDERGFELRSKDIFDMNMGSIQRLFDFIGVSNPGSSAICKALRARPNAYRQKRHAKSYRLSPDQQAAVTSIAGVIASELGYDI